MNWEQEQKLKERGTPPSPEFVPQPCEQAGTGSSGPFDYGEPRLQERLRNRQHRLQRDARKLDQISELLYLLDRQPEIARLLELFEAVGR